jgi:hypothetical protein
LRRCSLRLRAKLRGRNPTYFGNILHAQLLHISGGLVSGRVRRVVPLHVDPHVV